VDWLAPPPVARVTAAARVSAAALVLFGACALLRLPAAAQVVSGQVVLAGTEQGLAEVVVTLRFPDGRRGGTVVTDTAGTFRMHAPRLGAFILHAERIGLATVTTPEFRVVAGEEVEVVLQMAETAVPLEPLIVKARTAVDLGFLAGYYERIERQERLGAGHIFTRDRIEERQAIDVSDLLRDVPSLSVVEASNRVRTIMLRSSRGECVPKVYINGVRQNRGGAFGSMAVVDDVVRPHELEGVEVYRGISEMPADFYDEGHCGVVLLWTRRDAQGGRPYTLRLLLFGLAGLAGMIVLLMR
jgi:hypothetical protein